MVNSRWLKAVPEKETQQNKSSTPNVSMRDVRRIAQEKATRAAQEEQQPEKEKPQSEEIKSTLATTPTTGTTPTTYAAPPVAPERDFTRVANSILREALSAGIFTGKSKQVYDYLYSQTRGYVTPRRSVRLPMGRLMLAAGIGSDRTLRNNLRRLIDAGLVTVTEIGGSQGGNEFTVFLPGEVTPTTGTTPTTPTTFDHPYPLQKVGVVPVVESERGDRGLNVDNQATYGKDNTSFKTNTKTNDDDAALAGLNEALKLAAKEITGREPSAVESARWRELAEVLVMEAKMASTRTTVSSFPAFLAEHLRRRLWKKDKSQIEADERTAETKETESVSLTEEQIKSCTDCGGSNWYYPEGPEKGIKRCKHEKLKNSVK